MKTGALDIRNGPILKNIIIYSIPIFLTGILQRLFNAADLIVVGWFSGSDSVAAIGATTSLTSLIITLFIGLSVGTGAIVSQCLGAEDSSATFQTVHTAIPVAFIGGAVLSVIGVVFSKTFLELMGTPAGKLLSLSSVYMKIYFSGMIFSMLYNFGSAILRAAGDTKLPLIFLSISGVLNVILNVIFVALFNMDVAGVALATIISQGVSAVLVLIALSKRNDACRLDFKKMKIKKTAFFKIIRYGVPAGLQSSLYAISDVFIQSSINSFGTAHISGTAAASNLEGFFCALMNSFNAASLNFCGQNYGAGDLKRVKKVNNTCLLTVAAVGLFTGCLIYFFGRPLLGIYIHDSASAVNFGMERLKYFLIPYFIAGMSEVVTNSMRGIGYSFTPMVITIIGVCVMRIVWIYTVFSMPQYHSFAGLLISYPISWIFTFAAVYFAYTIALKKCEKQLKNAE